MAERVGFEPTKDFSLLAFQASALGQAMLPLHYQEPIIMALCPAVNRLTARLWQQPLGDNPVGSTPPAKPFRVGRTTSQTTKFAHHAGNPNDGKFFGRRHNKIRVVFWPWHMLAAMLEEHLLFDSPHVADVYVVFRRKVDAHFGIHKRHRKRLAKWRQSRGIVGGAGDLRR